MNLRNIKTISGWVTEQLRNANKVLQTLWFKCGQDSTMTLYLNLSSYMADARIFLSKRTHCSARSFADIMDGNLKLILGMIWTLVLRFTIADIR